tara:strand:+ start:155 stop:583 length:429 start_codon:yes stop_codon:yes gene_type:complete
MEIRTTTLQNVFRVILGIAMLYIGIGHFTFSRIEFQAQVPTWLTSEENLIDFVILASGIVEIILGALMIWGGKLKVKTGIALAIFYILIFPGNINQYINGIDAFNLNTDTKRLVRLFFQPLLLLWALWSTGGLRLKKNTNLK